MLDSGYNFGVINWFDVVRPTQLPSFPGEFGANGNTFFGVCQTRFGVKSSTNTGLGELKTIFEFSRRRPEKTARAPEGHLLVEWVCYSFSSVGFSSGVSSLQSCASVA
jgi:hypothetical protein